MNITHESWPRTHRLTVEDYHRMAEVGLLPADARLELIEGEIIEMAPIGSRHAAAVDYLAEAFFGALAGRAQVRVQGPVRLGPKSEPQPDIAILRRRKNRYADGHPTAQDALLLVEVSDATSTFDRDVKVKLYARHGIAEVWIVDLQDKRVHCFRDPASGSYRATSTVDAGKLTMPALAVDVELAPLWT